MTFRRRLFDRLRDRRTPGAGGTGASPETSGAPAGPIRPNRMVVSGRSPIMDWYRPFEQAHRVDPRMRLWRDTTAVLVVFAVAIAVFDWLPRPQQAVLSATDAPTQLLGKPQTIPPGSNEPPASASAGPDLSSEPATMGPPVAPSPATTPRPTPRPTPRQTPQPSPQSPSPSPSDTPTPTDTPAPSPTDTPNPTGTPAPAPPVAIIGTPVCAAASFTISFDGSASTGPIDTYAWDFGDLGSSSQAVIDHTYAAGPPTQYTVTLTVTGPGGSDIATVIVDVPCP